jgi:predicted ATPase
VNSFIGRSREVDEISNLLKRTRLITITGVGGSGKTRLAHLIAGRLLQSYPDGIWLIELASLRQSTLVLETLAQVLGLPERSERPLMDSLIAFLKPKQMLLVLDNCEHLIDSCATLVKVLAQTCPHVCLLCTSREPLHNPGEVIWRISALSLPEIKQVSTSGEISLSESVQLFVDRARAVLPDFTLNEKNAPAVAQICRRLDGLPLALELAAARVTVLSTEQIAERLDNCFSLLTTGSRTALTRQKTLRATLDWSYDLLSDQERLLFRRLAVFAGGFDLDAVSALEKNKEGEVLDLLAGLVDKSLVLAEEGSVQVRYHLLEPVRQYAEYWLGRSGEAKHVRRHHRDWFLARVEQANNALGGTQHNFWVAYLERELDNIRAALGWCLREPEEEIAGILLANALWQFWLLRGYLVEGRRWLDLCLQQTSDPTALRAETLLHAYALSIRQAEFATASGQNMVEKSLSIYRILSDTQGINSALQMYGIQAYMASDFVRARSSFSESRDLSQKDGQGFDYVLAMHSLGILAQAQGDLTSARQHLEESLTLLRGLDDQQGITFSMLNLVAMELPFKGDGQILIVDEETWVLLRTLSTSTVAGYVLANLASLSRLEGANKRAHSFLEESYELFQRIGDKAGFGQVLGQIGNLHRSEGSYEQAHAFLEKSLAVRQELGDHRGIGRTLNNLGVLTMVEGFYQQAQALFEQSMSHFADMGDTVGIAATIDNQGHLALFESDYSRARVLYTESRVIYQKSGDLIRASAAPTMHQGIAAQAAGDFAAARSSFEESLNLYTQLGDHRGIDRLKRLLANLEQSNLTS